MLPTILATFTYFFLPILAVPPPSEMFKQLVYPSGLYSNKDYPVDMLSCRHTLKKYKTLKDLPGYPFVGGAPLVNDEHEDGANCASCWRVTYRGESSNFLLIDFADGGFRVPQAALRNLTGGAEPVRAEIHRTSREDCTYF
ncbi:hypothetical protein NLI96_g10303 [Meripilus lineatus]|uniref:Cerato-platanin n=1 Tax=Meripilus lineatus TaxID=2056292 RepID=A0AAD5YEG7_9APHY|nr:hypothetical protein NLI96_g10303 [Physisporinus lineatus]